MIKSNIEEIYNSNEEPIKIDYNNERNRIYFSRRKELKNLITSINTYINYSSYSIFSALYFMDSIFTNSNLEKVFYNHFNNKSNIIVLKDIQMNNYALLSVACLILSYKFIENNLRIPSISSFTKLLYFFSNKIFNFSANDLNIAEVIVIKLLKYKLNYYTIYHFLIFFFTHGIILQKTLQKSKLYSKLPEKKILEKIYIQAREIIDWIIESEEYYNYYYGKDNHIIISEILIWTIEHILEIKITNDENIFKLIFNINISEIKHRKIVDIIERLYISKKLNIKNIEKPIFISRNYFKKNISISNQNSFSEMSQPINEKISSSYNNNYSTIPTYYDSYNLYNSIVKNEVNKLNSFHPYLKTIPNEKPAIQENENIIIHSVTGYPKNSKKRKLIRSNNYISSDFNIESLKIPLNNISNHKHLINLDEINNTEIKFEKEPIDNEKNKRKSIKINNIIDIKDKKTKKLIMVNSTKSLKQSISFHKKDNIILNENELNLNEKINKPRIFNNKIKSNINNILLDINPLQQIKKNNVVKNNNKTLFGSYNQGFNDLNSKILDKDNNNVRNTITSTETLLKKSRNIFTLPKLSQTIEIEPKDNHKKRNIKLKNSINNYNANKSVQNKDNKKNTIIIFNNIQINAYIDNKDYTKKSISHINNQNYSKNSNNIYKYNNINQKNVYRFATLSNLSNKSKNFKNKQKHIYKLKDSQNLINKSSNYLVKRLNNSK